MDVPQRLIFIHGLEGTSQGVKATLLRGFFPQIVIPDFRGSLAERMAALAQVLDAAEPELPPAAQAWTVIGSSFGGLMAAIYACAHPERVRRLILLAPALIWPDFAADPPPPIQVPTIIYHGRQDEIVPLEPTRRLASQIFHNLVFNEVDDNHGLYQTVHALDWPAEVEG